MCSFRLKCGLWHLRKRLQNNMTATPGANQLFALAQRELLAHVVTPWAGGIDDPRGLDGLFATIELVAKQHTTSTTVFHFQVQHPRMVSCLAAGLNRI